MLKQTHQKSLWDGILTQTSLEAVDDVNGVSRGTRCDGAGWISRISVHIWTGSTNSHIRIGRVAHVNLLASRGTIQTVGHDVVHEQVAIPGGNLRCMEGT